MNNCTSFFIYKGHEVFNLCFTHNNFPLSITLLSSPCSFRHNFIRRMTVYCLPTSISITQPISLQYLSLSQAYFLLTPHFYPLKAQTVCNHNIITQPSSSFLSHVFVMYATFGKLFGLFVKTGMCW